MRNVIRTMIGTSLVTTRPETSRGRIIALTARIRPTLARFEPMTFPSASPLAPLAEATTATTNSGADVPSETIVRPSTTGGTPNLVASRTAPRTSHSAPKKMTPTPPMSLRMSVVKPATPSGGRARNGMPPRTSYSTRRRARASRAAPVRRRSACSRVRAARGRRC